MSKNKKLEAAKRAKKDEFYTRLEDIEKEMNAYVEYNPDVFRGKTILLPCDDPEWSNFTRFFVSRFNEYGIKKLISTSYAPKSITGGDSYERVKILVLNREDENSDLGIEDLRWEYLEGDGDFRSEEVTALRDESDMVITNPPFSLFREFISWLIEGDVEFSVIGNMNAVTYKGVFPLIKDNKMWSGTKFNKTMSFSVPDEYFVKEGSEDKDRFGRNLVRVPAIRWFTNIPNDRKNKPLKLMTMEENLRDNKRIINNPNSYKTYENCDAIEVPITSGIPSDHEGVMGVPISFLDKYNPEQFEIVGSRNGNDGQYLRFLLGDGTYKTPYYRILIRHKNKK